MKKLYTESITLLNGKAFQTFQQCAVRNKVSLDNLIAIEFKTNKIKNKNIINKIIKYIEINYPNAIFQISNDWWFVR